MKRSAARSGTKTAEGTRLADNWKLRVAKVPNQADQHRFLNHFHEDSQCFYGHTCLYSPGVLQPLIEDDPDAQSLDISEKRAPKGTEYLHAIAYWLVIGDHFLIVQHVSLQAKAMEEYLTWLLRDRTSTVSSSHNVRLQAVFDRNLVGGDLGTVKSVEIGGLVPETVTAEPSRDEAQEQPQGRVVEYQETRSLGDPIVREFSKARSVIEAAIGRMETQKLMKQVPDEASLEVNVKIGYRSTRRKFKREFMSDVETSFRNLPDGELRVVSDNGVIVGDDARVQSPIPIRLVRENSSLLEDVHALEQLKEVYRRLLSDGRITD